MFSLINIIIYYKRKHFLLRAYIHRQQSVVTHLYKIIIIFKHSTVKFSIFENTAKYQKVVQRWGLYPQKPACLYFSYTALIKQYFSRSCMILNVLTKLCYQLCFSYLQFSSETTVYGFLYLCIFNFQIRFFTLMANAAIVIDSLLDVKIFWKNNRVPVFCPPRAIRTLATPL